MYEFAIGLLLGALLGFTIAAGLIATSAGAIARRMLEQLKEEGLLTRWIINHADRE